MQWVEMMIPGVPVGIPGVGVPRVEIPGALEWIVTKTIPRTDRNKDLNLQLTGVGYTN